MKCVVLALLLAAAVVESASAAGKRPMTIEDLFRFKRLSDPHISPDGKQVAYVVTTVDMDKNSTASSIWLAPTDKGEPRQLTNVPGKKDRHPRWSPDGKHLLFESNRGGNTQLWVIPLAGGEARQLTTISTEAGTGIWSPDGKHIAFVSAVYPEFSEKPFKKADAANKKKIDAIAKSPVKAKVHTRLFYRHWDSYVEDKRQHLFVMPWNGGKGGEPKDVTPGDRDANPTSSTFSIGDDFTFSPDGKYLVFTAVPAKNEAWSTNYDLCRVPISGGSTKWENLTKNNAAADGGPRFSPDGSKLAYRAQKQAGFEADRWQLLVVDVEGGGTFKGKPRSVTANVDASIESFVWGYGGSKELIFTIDEDGCVPTYTVAINLDMPFVERAVVQPMMGWRGSLRSVPPRDVSVSCMRKWIGPLRCSRAPRVRKPRTSARPIPRCSRGSTCPSPIASRWMSRAARCRCGFSSRRASTRRRNGRSFISCMAARRERGKTAGVSAGTRNYGRRRATSSPAQPRGSTGFGQKFVDAISGDWGGKCYDDLMKGVDYLEKLPYVDKDRMAAAGASFGGYMMNWFAVNTGRFKTLITHCGVWNFEACMRRQKRSGLTSGSTAGRPGARTASPTRSIPRTSLAANLGKFKTPMLIIHNDLDFRVPLSEGQQLFTSCSARGCRRGSSISPTRATGC